MDISFLDVLEAIKTLGVTKGLFVVFFIMAHGWIWSLYKGRLDDRQKEIDRIAGENREYRERFLKLMDASFSYSPRARKPESDSVQSTKENVKCTTS
jgi:hypothetical protein